MRAKILWTLVVLALLGVYPFVRLVSLTVASAGVAEDLAAIQTEAQRSNLREAAMVEKLDRLAAHALEASNAANDPLLAGFKLLPGLGADFDALGSVTKSVSELAVAAQAVFHDGQGLQMQHARGAFRAKTIGDFQTHCVELSQATAQAQDQLSDIEDSKLGFGLDKIVSHAQKIANSAEKLTDELLPLVNIFAGIFQDPQPKTWFVATQNLAEARGTGGIIGSYAIIQTSGGRASLLESGSDIDLAQLGPVRSPQMDTEYANFWGVDGMIWQDLNAGGDVPRAGQIIVDSWRAATNQDLSGVVFMGQGTVAHLVGLTGPITVSGKTLDSNSVAEYLAKGVYSDSASVGEKNRFVGNFARATFKALLSRKPDIRGLTSSALNASTGDRPYLYSTDASQQKRFDQQGVSGQISQNAGSRVWLTLNNAGGNKLEAYQYVSATYTLGECGTQNVNGLPSRKASLEVTLENRAPSNGLPAYVISRSDKNWATDFVPGANRELVSVYVPTGATDEGIYLNGKRIAAHFGMDGKRPIYQVTVWLNPGESKTIKFTWVEPTETTAGSPLTVTPEVNLQASYNPIKSVIKSTGFCPTK